MAIKINISSLNDGSQVLELKTDAKELGIDEEMLDGYAELSIELFKTVHQLDVKADISGKFRLVCDRCLEDFSRDFNSEFELVFVQQTSREEEINEDYIRTYSPHMKSVDITEDIKESIILAVPMKKLPAEKPDGSCSWCGKTKEYWSSILIDEEESGERDKIP
jgi:uncharacterized protein